MDSTESTKTTHSKKRHYWLLLAVPVLLGAGFCAVRAQAADDGFGFGPPAFGGGGTPEQHKAFMQRRLGKMLDMLKATDSQRTAIQAIAERMFAEMHPIHQQHKQLHDAIVAAFTADTVDRAGVEKLRLQVTALVDQGSQVFSKALLDAAQVLTPEQRQTLAKFVQEHHGGRHHFN
ncbi:MAG TPA: Spy/CpxP family protein refolding chaperone [Polyangia bacterium]